MNNIDTKPLGRISGKPVSVLRIAIATIVGLVAFFGGLALFIALDLLVVWALICVVAIVTIISVALLSTESMRKKSIAKFASANNFTKLSQDKLESIIPPSLNDMGVSQLFENGYSIKISGVSISLFDFYFDDVVSKKREQYSIAVLPATSTYPHMFLDAKQNNTNNTYNSAQRLSLEGNFDEFFNLYSLDDTNIETLSFLTPDIMQLFIDNARMFDVEVKDNYIYLITHGTSVYYRTNMDRLLACLNAIIGKIEIPSEQQPVHADITTTSSQILKKNNRNMLIATAITVTIVFISLLMVLLYDL